MGNFHVSFVIRSAIVWLSFTLCVVVPLAYALNQAVCVSVSDTRVAPSQYTAGLHVGMTLASPLDRWIFLFITL